MADSYLQFSEGLLLESRQELEWLKEQLEVVEVAILVDPLPDDERPPWYIVPTNAEDYREGYEPAGGCPRFLLDFPELSFDDIFTGFQYEFVLGEDEHAPGHVVLYAAESGSPERLAHLVQQYLQTFHPDRWWALSWASTCSKLRPGEFGGGAVLVTAETLRWLNVWQWIEDQIHQFEQREGR